MAIWCLVAGVSPAVAGPRIPVETVACHTTLDHSVQLAADVDCSGVSSTFGLYLYARGTNLVLDLGGHDLILGPSQVYGIYVDSPGTTIRNGRILLGGRAYSSAILTHYENTDKLAVSNVEIAGTGVEYGVFLDHVGRASLDRVTIDRGFYGIFSYASNVTIARSSATAFRVAGFWSSYDYSWRGTDLTATAEPGRTAVQTGFYSESSDLFDLRYSRASGARGNLYSAGIEVDMPNFEPGYTRFRATLIGNRMLDNEIGLAFYGSTAAYTTRGATEIRDNVATGNVGDGFYFYLRRFNPLSITNNLAKDNGDDGFEIANHGGSCAGSCSFDLSLNTARLNADKGFVSGYTDIPTSDNGVSRNGGLRTLTGQCVNVSCYLLAR